MNRCGVPVIILGKGPDAVETGGVDHSRKHGRLGPHLLSEPLHEILHIYCIGPSSHDRHRSREIAGHGKHDSPLDLARDHVRILAKILEGLVAAHAESHQKNTVVPTLPEHVKDDCVQIVGHTAVVHAQQPVGFSRTSPKIQTHGIISDAVHLPGHAKGVFLAGMTFEAMADDDRCM